MKQTYKGVVYPWECDFFDHMNTQFYVAKFDAAAHQFFGEMGMDRMFLETEKKGMVAVDQRIQYSKELVSGDLVFIESTLQEVRDKAIRFKHRLINQMNGEVAAEAEYISVFIDLKTRRAIEIPKWLKKKLNGMIEA